MTEEREAEVELRGAEADFVEHNRRRRILAGSAGVMFLPEGPVA